jgi:hypothetical protein
MLLFLNEKVSQIVRSPNVSRSEVARSDQTLCDLCQSCLHNQRANSMVDVFEIPFVNYSLAFNHNDINKDGWIKR